MTSQLDCLRCSSGEDDSDVELLVCCAFEMGLHVDETHEFAWLGQWEGV